jgi:hypothetical protein
MKILKYFAYYFTIFFILFVLINIFSHLYLRNVKTENVVIAKYDLENLVKAYPDCPVNTIQEILDETWSRQVIYSSYVQFKEQEKRGKYVNVSPNGFRLNRASEEHPFPLRKDAINIFVFGGSTTFGYGVRDYETIPAQLESIIRKKYSRIRVYNFGCAFYMSSQERVLFEKLLASGHMPDVVIFIDGLNEFYRPDGEPTYNGHLTNAFDNSFYAAQAIFFNELPVVRLARYCRGIMRKKLAKPPKKTSSTVVGNENIARVILSRYMANVQMIKAVADQRSIKSFFIWQPVPEYKMDIGNHPFYFSGDQDDANRKTGYALAKQMLPKELPYVIWAAEITPFCAGNFVDQVHYSAKFNREIAEFIFDTTAISILNTQRIFE